MSCIDAELLGILENRNVRKDARIKGWEYLLGLTANEDGVCHILKEEKYIKFLLFCIEKEEIEEEFCSFAHKCLINISAQEKAIVTLKNCNKDLVKNLLRSITDDNHSLVQSKCYILSNISSHFEIKKEIFDIFVSSEDIQNKLIRCFFSNNSKVKEKYDFLALVFGNISRLPDGRRLLLENDYFMNGIVTCVNISEPQIRRLGAAFVLRNCCCSIAAHQKLLEDLNILPVILLPLMGPEDYMEEEGDKLPLECQCLEDSKQRDPSTEVRRTLIQALISLCYSEKGWSYLKDKGVYYVLRELHLWEKDPKNKEAIETVVAYLLVEQYSPPKYHGNVVTDDCTLIEQLEGDISRDIPDIVI